MIDNYEYVRGRIARFMGWEWNERRGLWTTPSGEMWQAPDPLNYSGDAWALQCALIERKYSVLVCYGSEGCGVSIFGHGSPSIWRYGAGATPAEALVRAWMEAFPDE